MSAPFGIHITVVSGQRFSGEIAVAASTFLAMDYLAIRLLSNEGSVREEFLKALEVFEDREGFYYRKRPRDFVEKLMKPQGNIPIDDFFWLALDKEGETIATNIFAANGEVPHQLVHRLIRKLNLLEQTILHPPQVHVPLQYWQESAEKQSSLSYSYRKLKPKKSYQLYMNENAPLSPEQTLYCDWFERLYESLISWQDTIKGIQSDLS